MLQETARQKATTLLENIVNGTVDVLGCEKGNPESLQGKILPLKYVPDGTLNMGDIFPFGNKWQAKVLAVETPVGKEPVEYHIQLTYQN